MRISRNQSQASPVYAQTKQRQLLLDIIQAANGHIDAKGLVKIAAEKDDSISAATVYRNLNLFKKLGIIDEQRLGQAHCYYELKRSPQHQHLVCGECGKVIDFACPLGEMVERVKREHGFTVTKAEIYFEGYCAECASRKEKSK